jgi:uncharacterized FlaG/YvyC family protein
MESKPVEQANVAIVNQESLLNRNDMDERRALIKAVRAINATALFGENYELTFVLDRETNRPILRIIDRKTREVIRQLPPEYALRLTEEIGRQIPSS